MRKIRNDRKKFNVSLAAYLYFIKGQSLHTVAEKFNINHTNLMMRFRRHGLKCRSISESLKLNSEIRKPKGKKAYNWKGGKSIDVKGYIMINRTKQREHRVIAESVLGRKLKTKEVVHHINGVKWDNRKCNLLICSAEYHSWLEAKLQNNLIGQNIK